MKTIIFAILISLGIHASAEEFYMSAAAGQSFVSAAGSTNDNPESYKAAVGVRQPGQGWGVELSRTDIGEIGCTADGMTARMKGFSLVGVRSWALDRGGRPARVFMKLGMASAKTEFGIISMVSEKKNGLTYSLGAEGDLDEHFGLFIEATSIDTGVDTIDRATVVVGGLVARF